MDWQGMGKNGHTDTGLEAIPIVQIRKRVMVMQTKRKSWLWDTNPNLRITMSEHISYLTVCV